MSEDFSFKHNVYVPEKYVEAYCKPAFYLFGVKCSNIIDLGHAMYSIVIHSYGKDKWEFTFNGFNLDIKTDRFQLMRESMRYWIYFDHVARILANETKVSLSKVIKNEFISTTKNYKLHLKS